MNEYDSADIKDAADASPHHTRCLHPCLPASDRATATVNGIGRNPTR